MARYWMRVTQDAYQLPMAVGTSCAELSRITGLSPSAIRAAVHRWKLGQRYPSCILIEIEEDEDA